MKIILLDGCLSDYGEHPRCQNPECPEGWMGVSGKAAWLASHVIMELT